MAIYDLSPSASATTTVNVVPRTRGNLVPVTGSPFAVNNQATTILQTNSSAATTAIFNAGPGTVLLLEGTSPVVSATAYNYPLPPNRLWEPDPSLRFLGAMQAIAPSSSATVYVSQSITLL